VHHLQETKIVCDFFETFRFRLDLHTHHTLKKKPEKTHTHLELSALEKRIKIEKKTQILGTDKGGISQKSIASFFQAPLSSVRGSNFGIFPLGCFVKEHHQLPVIISKSAESALHTFAKGNHSTWTCSGQLQHALSERFPFSLSTQSVESTNLTRRVYITYTYFYYFTYTKTPEL